MLTKSNKTMVSLNALKGFVGKENVLSTLEDRICYAYDGTKQKYIPDVVVRPRSTRHVSDVLRFANEHEIPVYPRGAGSGLTGGAVPVQGGIVLEIGRASCRERV